MKSVSPRYGIAEWYGKDITSLTNHERQSLGLIAIKQEGGETQQAIPICPFLSNLIPGALCNKAGGVCSIRKIGTPDGTIGTIVPGDAVVTVCPSRFLQTLEDGATLFSWISEKMLDLANPTVVKETPFLRKISESQRDVETELDMQQEAVEEGKKAGRIDWILVDPKTISSPELSWCAVETQALYFSGGNMRVEFSAYASAPTEVLFPIGKRRPDYRSSGPKRLAPQLDVKVPVLRNWGKKVVVVIDRYFFANMNNLIDAYPRAKNEQEKRDNADVVWFVVDYAEDLKMKRYKVVYTSLESSRHALNATEPLSKTDFTNALRQVINSNNRQNKVFKASE
ncbi:hypothetical protein GCM10011613_25440 [Cellvibrio zantedeschiae]|uniref:Restriction endonuclease type II NotI domain-containing protein n=1 Tax=Cellvibrio zantedeschiae TaxID=1237077 RepID=A0ABQ3B5R5_9GAMM|nr:NotI family restriction endonuclease [Cellvibrio zantedeschiae]GGY79493.1 hypothetical protein GCM10011613_25440 [Cellvibrio zantedeschiae]